MAAARPGVSERRSSSSVLVTVVVPSLCWLQVTAGGPSVALAPSTSQLSWAAGRERAVQFTCVSPEGDVECVSWGVWGRTEDERGDAGQRDDDDAPTDSGANQTTRLSA